MLSTSPIAAVQLAARSRCAAVAALTLAATVLWSCDNSAEQHVKGDSPPAQPAANQPPAEPVSPGDVRSNSAMQNATNATGRAQLEFDSLTYDFGVISETEVRRGQLPFTNTGDAPLVIDTARIKTTCGCTAVDLERDTYQPGESGMIEIVFDPSGPNEPGRPQRKYVNIPSNGAATPDGITTVTVLADVRAFITIEPRFLQLGIMTLGESHEADITVSADDRAFSIEKVAATNPHVTAEVIEVPADVDSADGAAPTRIVRVRVDDDAPWGGFLSWLTIDVVARPSADAEPMPYSARIRIQGEVFGRLVAEPYAFRFGALPGETFERELVLTHRDGQPFDIADTAVTCTAVSNPRVELHQLAPHRWMLTLHATATGIGPARGTVRVTSSVDGPEADLEIPIIGVVRQPGQ